MAQKHKKVIFVLRLVMGWVFFYAGYSKIIDADWTAAGYLGNASTFPQLFAWFADPARIDIVNFLNEWGLLAVGVALLLGAFVRYASYAGILLMVLYWLPALEFPYVGGSFLISHHIVYIAVLVTLTTTHAGKWWGLDKWLRR